MSFFLVKKMHYKLYMSEDILSLFLSVILI